MPAIVTIEFVVPAGYEAGDYAKLCGNGGSGAIDWDNPLDNSIYELLPNGSGIYGFGHAPFGHHRFGHGHSMRTAGFGRLPFGHHPFGHGTAVIRAQNKVVECGDYKYGLACYDKLGNVHSGTPDEETVVVHIAPEPPTGLKKFSYSEFITNGDFSAWTADDPDDWEVFGESSPDPEISQVGAGQGHGGAGTGLCNIYTSDGSQIYIKRTFSNFVVGRTYRFSMNIDTIVSGGIHVDSVPVGMMGIREYTTTGTKTFSFVAISTFANLHISNIPDEAADATIDNVSIHESSYNKTTDVLILDAA